MNKIYGLLRVRNEEKIIEDTLQHLAEFCNAVFVYDDCSTDNTYEICKNHPIVKSVVKGETWDVDRERAESENRQMLLEEAQKHADKNDWFVYIDADERIDFDWSIIPNLSLDIIAIRMKLFDFYITPEDVDKKYYDRKWIGPEYREIVIAFRNSPFLRYDHLDQREVSLGNGKILSSGFVKHYGKAISVEEWENTCEYYSKYFKKYSEKWEKRKGKAIHYGYSDFNNPLITWDEKEEKGIDLKLLEQKIFMKGKMKKLKILLTNHHLQHYQGTEIYTLVIAKKLKELGHEVFVYSRYIGEIKKEFIANQIPIVTNIEALKNFKFDVAHVHHNINAIEVRQLFKDLPIIFVSHGIIPFLEQPPIIEIGVSKYIAVSEEVFENLVNKGVNKNDIIIIRNPIDENYFYPKSRINPSPKNALIISNKIDEKRMMLIKQACDKLNINLKIIGGSYGNFSTEYVREFINQADIVFTLGRGALESIFCERVVIIYDYQGGDGIITENNFEEIMKCNFSGRKYNFEFDVDTLVNEINKYETVDVNRVKEKALKYFSSEKVISSLLDVYEQSIGSSIDKNINNELIDNFVNTIKEVNYYSSRNNAANNSLEQIASSQSLKIGLFASDYSSACSRIRVVSVLQALNKSGLIHFFPLFDLKEKNKNVSSIKDLINVYQLRDLDLLIVQREFCVNLPFDELKEMLHDTNVKIIYEIDDNLLDLYPSHPLYYIYKNNKNFYQQYLSKSDLITVTTPSLKNSLKHYSDKIAVLPNYIDEEIWKFDIKNKFSNKKIKILFSGSKTHIKDLEEIEDAIIAIYNEFKDQIELIFWGDVSNKIENNCSITKIDEHIQSYSDYSKFLINLNIDIGLIPLKMNKFNQCKSNIKWLDYSMAGIASILTDFEPYNTTVIDQINGLLVKNNPKEWYEAIKELIVNNNKRKAIANNAYDFVKSNFTIQKNMMKWYSVYSSLIRLDTTKQKTNFSLITLTYNNVEYTKKFYESLLESNPENYELIIVDNASTDSTKEFLNKISKENENVKVIFNKTNLGFPIGINQAIKKSKGKYILIANNDIIFTNRCIERMINVIESQPEIGIVAPISNEVSGLQKDEKAKYNSIEEMHEYAAKIKEKNKDQILQFPRVAFLCTLIKKEVINKIGGLDERFSPGNFEDDDFCLRAQLAGFKTVIAKDVFIHHFGSKSFKANGLEEYKKRLEINRQIFIDKWGADPDEIWLKNKMIKQHQIYYPIDQNLFKQHLERTRIHIADNEIELAQKEIEKAIDSFDEKSGEFISLVELLNLAGNLFLATNNFEKAKAFFEKELETNPSSSTACFGLGQIFMVEEQIEAAKTMFEWSVKNDQNNEQAINALKNVNEILGLEINHNSLMEMNDA